MILLRVNNNLDHVNVLLTLSHEMVHAYQFYTGELVRHDRTTYTWKGKLFRNIEQIAHHRRPWEIEAHQYSRLLRADIDFIW